MDFFVDAMQKGGPFMWLLLLLAVAAPCAMAVGAAVTALRKWVPSILWWLVPACLVMAGAVGRIQGQIMVAEAVNHASVETKSLLLHAGTSVAAYTEWAGWGMAFVALTLSALMAGASLVLGAGERARSRMGMAAMAFLLGLGGAALVGLVAFIQPASGGHFGTEVWLLPLVLLCGGVALALASLRDSDDPAAAQRLAAGRAGVAAMVVGSVVAVWVACSLHGQIFLHDGVARASAETRQTLVAMGVTSIEAWALPGMVALLVAIVAGAVVSASGFRHLLRPRQLASGVGTGLLLLLVAMATGYSNHQAVALSELTVEKRVMGILERVDGLSSPLPLGADRIEHQPLHSFVESATWDGGDWRLQGHDRRNPTPLALPVDRELTSGVLVAAPADLPAAKLVSTEWAQRAGEPGALSLLVLVRQGEPHPRLDSPWLVSSQAGMVELESIPSGLWDTADAPEVADIWETRRSGEYGTWNDLDEVLFLEGRAGGLALHTSSKSVQDVTDLAAAVADLVDEQPTVGSGAVVVVPGNGWTLQDLVSHCLAARNAVPAPVGESWEQAVTGCAVTERVPPVLEQLRGQAPADEGLGSLDGLGSENTASPDSGGVIILGALDKSLIQQVVKRHLSQIQYCYERSLSSEGPSLQGKVTVKFVVAKDGSVSTANIKSSTVNNERLESCVAGRFLRMKFPAPKGGGIVIVSYPFVFSSG